MDQSGLCYQHDERPYKEQVQDRLRKMSDRELIRWGKEAAWLARTNPSSVEARDLARKEWWRRLGSFLRVAGDPQFGLPFGQDRLIPLWVATVVLKSNSREVRFTSAAQILDTFGLPKDGKTANRRV